MDLGAFLASLDWGSVADWFTGLLTAGTLFVAVMILYSDRRSAARAGADGFATWIVRMGTHAVKGKANYTVVVHAFNAGDRPIPFAIVIPAPSGKEQWPGTMLTLDPLEPGAHVTQEIGLDEIWDLTPLLLDFRDGRGRRWIRSLSTNRYISRSEARRAFKRWGADRPFNGLWHGVIPEKKLDALRKARYNALPDESTSAPVKKSGRSRSR